jgi:hypothetical protein
MYCSELIPCTEYTDYGALRGVTDTPTVSLKMHHWTDSSPRSLSHARHGILYISHVTESSTSSLICWNLPSYIKHPASTTAGPKNWIQWTWCPTQCTPGRRGARNRQTVNKQVAELRPRANSQHSTLDAGVLHCTALHCTALHCTALHCTALALIQYANRHFVLLTKT